MDEFVTSRKVQIPTEIKRLEESKSVWALRSVHPKPGMRLLGQFLRADCFVATELQMRARLGGRQGYGWKTAIHTARAEFSTLFSLKADNGGIELITGGIEIE